MDKKILIGLVGEKGSGKETVGKIIIESLIAKNVAHVKFSDLLKETLTLWSLPHTRANLQDLAIIMDQHFGKGTLAHAMFLRIENLPEDVVILDGVRWDADLVLLNRFSNHHLIYVTADVQTRFKRISTRTEKVDEGKDFNQFLKDEQKLNEINIPKFGAKADFEIVNMGSIDDLRQKVLNVIKKIV